MKVSVCGSHNSGTSTELSSVNGRPIVCPPMTTTCPFGNTTALLKMRAYAIGATRRTDRPTFASITSALVVAGCSS